MSVRTHPKIRMALVLIAAAVLAGCPPPRDTTIVNNSDKDLRVKLRDGDVDWPKGSLLVISYGEERTRWSNLPGAAVSVGEPNNPTLVVANGALTLCYRGLYPSTSPEDKHLKDFGWYRNMVLQLQPDFGLYAVQREATLPVAELDTQPDGFPIPPDSTNCGVS